MEPPAAKNSQLQLCLLIGAFEVKIYPYILEYNKMYVNAYQQNPIKILYILFAMQIWQNLHQNPQYTQ